MLRSAGPGFNPRVKFYDKFQREMEEHDRDLERKYDEDLNTTLIFVTVRSRAWAGPRESPVSRCLLWLVLPSPVHSRPWLPTGSVATVPRWPGPGPVVVQVQCILYATLSATLLTSFLAMLWKQRFNRYRQSETHGWTADRTEVRERKLSGIETWKFHIVMESLPLISLGTPGRSTVQSRRS